MNEFMVQQNLVSTRESLVCPKPRRLGWVNAAASVSVIINGNYQPEIFGTILETIPMKRGDGAELQQRASSPPPYFCGSPPSRVANPVVQDARFGDAKVAPLYPMSPIQPPMSSSSSPRKGGCVPASFGGNPAVRIEGFDSRNCTIPALA